MDKAFLEYPLHKFHCDRQDIFSMWPTLPFIYIKHNYPNLITFFVKSIDRVVAFFVTTEFFMTAEIQTNKIGLPSLNVQSDQSV